MPPCGAGPSVRAARKANAPGRSSIDEIRERGFNLDIKNPHVVAEDQGDPETLLNDLTKAEASVEQPARPS